MRPSQYNFSRKVFEWNLLVFNQRFRLKLLEDGVNQDAFDLLVEAANNVYGNASLKTVTKLLYRIGAESTDPWYFVEGESGTADFFKLQLLAGPHWYSILKMMDIKNGRIPETGVLGDNCPTDEENPEIAP